jgi:hypothetical protein
MTRSHLYTGGVLVVVFSGLTFLANAQSETSSAADRGFKPAASIEALMHGQNLAFQNLGRLIEDKQAKNRANAIFLDAELLAELANVNIHHKDKADYRAFATTVRDTALDLAREARKRGEADEGKMKSLYDKLNLTCLACHDVYK